MGLADAGYATFSGLDLPAVATMTQSQAIQQLTAWPRAVLTPAAGTVNTSADCHSLSSFISIFLVPLVSRPFLTQGLFNKKDRVLRSHCW